MIEFEFGRPHLVGYLGSPDKLGLLARMHCGVNTPSHFLIGAAVARYSKQSLVTSAFLWGSLAPDIPLYLLSVGGWFYYRYARELSAAETMNLMFEEHFFHDPIWIALHNCLHSPLILAIAIAVLWPFRHAVGSLQRWGLHFFLASSIHTALDIPTHVYDGPLLLFPLNWSWRFESPISYWDSRYFGREFAVFELVLDIALIAILVVMPFLRTLWLAAFNRASGRATATVETATVETATIESEASPPADRP